MRSIDLFVRQHFAVVITAVVVWMLLATTTVALYRRRKGKCIFVARPADAIFFETWTSGRSNRSLWTKLGAANRCLAVAVMPAAVTVRVHFPFNLLGAGLYDLEQNIPRENILSAQRTGRSGKTIELIFRTPRGDTRSFNLLLRDPDSFLAALGSK